MPFRFAAKYGLLTYSQCGDLDGFAVSDRLSELGAECIVAEEDHQDGGRHIHVFFMFESEFRTKNERVFDVDGYHPNIVRGRRTPEKGWDYATKDGDIIAGGLARPQEVEDKGEIRKRKFREAMAEPDPDLFVDKICEEDPSYALRYHFQIQDIKRMKLEATRKCSPPLYTRGLDTSAYPELDQWVFDNLTNPMPG